MLPQGAATPVTTVAQLARSSKAQQAAQLLEGMLALGYPLAEAVQAVRDQGLAGPLSRGSRCAEPDAEAASLEGA